MPEADRLLRDILEHGDLVDRDPSGRSLIQLAVDPRDFEQLMQFGADATEAEDGGDYEPDEALQVSACWLWEAPRSWLACLPGPA